MLKKIVYGLLVASVIGSSFWWFSKRAEADIPMANIPAGSFIMGACGLTERERKENIKRAELNLPPISAKCDYPDPLATAIEMPAHPVSIDAFQMSKTEVTLGQFKRYLLATENPLLADAEFQKNNAYGDDAPVVYVSLDDVQLFIKWLNHTYDGGYRLPSEAEWEYACRAGTMNSYCGGQYPEHIAWYGKNSGNRPHPVAQKAANAFGLYDMSGNVFEWVADCAHDDYVDAPKDGRPWLENCELLLSMEKDEKKSERPPTYTYRLRGGAFRGPDKLLRATDRSHGAVSGWRTSWLGFRLARSL